MKQVKVALIGFGGIARSHYAGYQRLAKTDAPLSLVAVCDINPDQLTRQITINTSTEPVTLPSDMHTYTDVDAELYGLTPDECAIVRYAFDVAKNGTDHTGESEADLAVVDAAKRSVATTANIILGGEAK